MNTKRTRLGHAPRLALLAAACMLFAGIAAPLTAKALPVLYDGRFYYTGGDITIDVLYYNSIYDNVLQLRSALGTIDLAQSSQVGTQAILTEKQLAGMGIGVGDELQFGLHVRNTGHDFVLGPGDLNIDGISHAYIRPSSASKYYVGFEDLWGGGDRDYNDTIFRFSGGLTTTRAQELAQSTEVAQIAEPSMLLLLLPGFGLLGLKRRKK